jgi:hypothetical protein
MNLKKILFPDAKNSCMKKTTANLKLKNVPMNRSPQFVTQHGAKTKSKQQITNIAKKHNLCGGLEEKQ